ncbi:MAG: PDZ domain-containing protein [Actinomycetota bacterium]|nr:PDZ domain-containing protein [Actinomycetota bacterium]
MRWVVAGVLAIALAAAAVFVSIPVVFVYLPGPVRDVEELVQAMDAKTYSSEGRLYMTTVSVDTSVTFVELVGAWIDPDQQVVMRDQVTGGQSLRELRQQQEQQMMESQNSATMVALGALGRERPTGDGVTVVSTVEGSPAHGVLRRGDRFVSMQGEEITTACDVEAVIDAREPGDTLEFVVERDGRPLELEAALARDPQGVGAFLGVEMRTINFSFEPRLEVDFETGRIAGPSAGLMLALGLYDQLTPSDLTEGRTIAGTGTISCGGGVGAIGGIRQKVAGAEARGAQVFFAPEQNASEARAVADDIEIVAISTFAEALEYLSALD